MKTCGNCKFFKRYKEEWGICNISCGKYTHTEACNAHTKIIKENIK